MNDISVSQNIISIQSYENNKNNKSITVREIFHKHLEGKRKLWGGEF